MYRSLFLLITISLLTSVSLCAQSVKINEVVAANSQHQDEDGDTPDWLELRNFSATEISVNGWQLTDDLSADTYWTLPDLSLSADTHLQIWASGKDRISLGVARTLVNPGDLFRYVIATQPLSNQWKSIGFNDDAWPQGNSGFGYGDEDDQTIIPNGTIAVFLRKSFNIANKDLIEDMILDIDYDDAFVAYLNGVEIARANINGTNPAYDATAITDREAEIYSNGLPERYLIDNPQALLQNGENVLSIQVHNISAFSSDMSLIPFLSAVYAVPTTEGTFPNVLIPISAGGLHTNFKISSAGETIYLLDAESAIIDSLVTGSLPADVSVGIPYEETENLAYFTSPTPGEPNLGISYEGVHTENIIFSQQGGTVPAFNLGLSGVAAPAVIRYTLNASIPDETSTVYSGTIPITENTVVRARIFRDNYLPSSTQSKAYLVGNAHDLPIISLITEPDNFFDEESGIYVLGDEYETDFPYFGANFWEDWERPVHLSLYEPSGQLGLDIDAGAKIFGGWSRGQAQKSFSLFARNQYGVNQIDYPLFPNRPYETYQAFVLRNSGNDFLNTNMRDLTLTSLMEGTGLELQANRPAVTYINGEYWGFYNMREKVNEHFLAAKHNLDPDELNILEGDGWLIHGDNQAYLDLIDFVNSNSLVSDFTYDQVAEQVDIENFIIYYVAQIYFNNTDWPGNNIKFWQPVDGKWRWILFDTDFGFGTWNAFDYFNNTLNFALDSNGPGWPNPPWSTLLFRKLMENTSFRNEFVNRYADELNSRFLPASVSIHIDSLAERVESEIERHYQRWGGNTDTWTEQVDNMKNFGNLRPLRAKQHIRSTLNLVEFHQLTIEIANTQQGYVRINNRLTIEENIWRGDYFQGVPFAVQAIARPGYVFSHWESTQGSSTNENLSIDIQGPMTLQPIFAENPINELPIVINEINYNSLESFDTGDWVELYNPNDFSLDVSNWVMKDDDDSHSFVLPTGTVMEANSYWVLTKDISLFQQHYPDLDNVVGDFDFGLSGNGDAVRLYNTAAELQDEVVYLPTNPWPEAANGQGPTLELISPELDNSLAENWANVHPFGSPGATNILTNTTEPGTLMKFQYFPNPITDHGNIQLQLATDAHLSIVLYDARGVAVKSLVDARFGAGQHIWNVELHQLPLGMYLLETRIDGKREAAYYWAKL